MNLLPPLIPIRDDSLVPIPREKSKSPPAATFYQLGLLQLGGGWFKEAMSSFEASLKGLLSGEKVQNLRYILQMMDPNARFQEIMKQGHSLPADLEMKCRIAFTRAVLNSDWRQTLHITDISKEDFTKILISIMRNPLATEEEKLSAALKLLRIGADSLPKEDKGEILPCLIGIESESRKCELKFLLAEVSETDRAIALYQQVISGPASYGLQLKAKYQLALLLKSIPEKERETESLFTELAEQGSDIRLQRYALAWLNKN